MTFIVHKGFQGPILHTFQAISKKPVILKEVLVLTKEIPRVHSAPSSAFRSRPGPVHKDAEFAFSSTCAQ